MSESTDDLVVVGTIARPHGLRGHVLVRTETDFPDERFGPGRTLLFVAADGSRRPQRLTVRDARPHLGRMLVAFEDIERLEDAEPLVRGELKVASSELMPLPPGTYYHHQLVGCEVTTTDGEQLGRVVRVDEGGGAMLAVAGRRGEVLVPLASEICVEIDVVTRRIVIAPPPGLLDVNV